MHSFVAISRHPPRSVSGPRGHASRSSLQEHEREAPRSPGRWKKVAARTRQPETAEGNSWQRQHATGAALRCDFRVRRTEPHHRWAGDSVLKGLRERVPLHRESVAAPRGRSCAGINSTHRTDLASRHSADRVPPTRLRSRSRRCHWLNPNIARATSGSPCSPGPSRPPDR